MKRLTHIMCLFVMLGIGLISARGGYAYDHAAMADCCDPAIMTMAHVDDSTGHHANCMDMMDQQECPDGGLCCDGAMMSSASLLIKVDDQQFPHERSLVSYVPVSVPQGSEPGHIAPPPIA
ncbi:MAG: hypothetical protein HWE25_04120 [Alphaproteobacteria bacterium]|nr:hypothetical protein [Alphaproteobacteria bacterium]